MIDTLFQQKLELAERGKKRFTQLLKGRELNGFYDSFFLILTDNQEAIDFGVKYLKKFKEFHHKENVYIFLNNNKSYQKFSNQDCELFLCSQEEMLELIQYLRLFHLETSILFFTDKDDYGANVEQLLKEEEFTLEEYVAVGIYRLDGLEIVGVN